jgi:hypothetical protein
MFQRQASATDQGTVREWPARPSMGAYRVSTSEKKSAVPQEGALEVMRGFVDQLDLSIVQLLTGLFPEAKLNGIEFVTILCHQATETRISLVPGEPETAVAVMTCQGVEDLTTRPDWKWSREQTLIMLQVLEALTILVRKRRARRTEIHVPLGNRHLDCPFLLARLTSPLYTNAKTQRLLARTATRLRSQLPFHEEPEPGLARWHDGLITILKEEGVSRSCRQRISFRLALAGSAPRGPIYSERGERSGRTQETILRRSPSDAQELDDEVLIAEPSSHRREPPQEATVQQREPNQDEHDHDGSGDEVGTPDSRAESAYQEPEEETQAIWQQLTTPEQRRLPGNARQMQRIRQWLEEQPTVVRAAMINVLFQRVFPDRHGQPGLGWFLNTYRLYGEGKLAIAPEIASWVWTSFTYEEIETALRTERHRQEQRLLPPTRPDVSCIQQNDELQEENGPVPSLPTAGGMPFIEENVSQMAEALVQEEEEIPAAPINEDSPQMVIPVSTPEIGWRDEFGVRWWAEKLCGSPLAETHAIEIWPTQYGRFVLLLVPQSDPASAWLWTTGGEVRSYLEEARAAK